MLQSAAHPITFIQNRILMSHNANANTNHQMDQPSQKWRASKIHAGIVHSRFRTILISRHSQKLPLRFVLLMPKGQRTWEHRC